MSKRNKSSKKRAPQAQSRISFPSTLPLGVLAGIALIVVIAFIAYFPTLSNGFVWDDDALLTNNSLIKSSEGLCQFWYTTKQMDYWPVTYTTLWIEWRLWGINATGYHVTNLVLHIITSLLIWLILRKLSVPGAFLAAMIFTVHPVNVESVAWIAQRKNLMAMLFFLLSILWYLKFLMRAHRPTSWCPFAAKQIQSTEQCPPLTSSFILHPSSFNLWYWLSLTAFVLAMLSKGSVAVLPALLLGIVWWLRPLTRWDLARTAPFFAVAVVLAGVNVWFQTHGTGEVIRTAGFIERLLGAGGVVWFYLYKAILPINLVFIYRQWHIEMGNLLWWLPLSASIIVTAVLWLYRKGWSRPYLFAWGFFCVSLVPVMGLTDVYFMRYALVADHYQHIAIIGVIALAAAGWSCWHQRAMQPATITGAVLVCALIFLTREQNRMYHDIQTLYQTTIDRNPDCWMAHNNLGGTLYRTGRQQEAIEHFRQALRLNPNYHEAHNNLGVALDEKGRRREAIEHFKKALQLKPDYADAHYNLGISLVKEGLLKEAIKHYQQTLLLNPNYPNAHYNLGNTLVQAGLLEEAIKYYQQALLLNPNYPEVHNNLGNTLANIGRPQEAIEHYQQALRLKYTYPEAHNNLGRILSQAGQPQEAIKHYRQALQINPDFAEAYFNLALTNASMQQSSEAVAAAQKALELAQSKGQTALAKQIEDWLNSYRAGQP